jgi:hypothetical protein
MSELWFQGAVVTAIYFYCVYAEHDLSAKELLFLLCYALLWPLCWLIVLIKLISWRFR